MTTTTLDLRGSAGFSHSYQEMFASGYRTEVLGRDIDTIKVGVVAGASLTGIGFMKALEQIESQARG